MSKWCVQVLKKPIDADNETKEVETYVSRGAAGSMTAHRGGDINTFSLMSADIDSLTNIVAARKLEKASLVCWLCYNRLEWHTKGSEGHFCK